MHFKTLFLIASLMVAFQTFNVEANRKSQGRTSKDLFKETFDNTTSRPNSGRKGKLFSLFNVVTFNNDPCSSTTTLGGGVNRNGTCYTNTECSDRGGSVSGNCAAGFGVCCVFLLDGTGSTVITENCTYIQNQGFPTPITTASTQSFTVQKCNDDVCFLRLDFEMFTLLGTNGSTNPDEGVCLDMFTVTTATGMNVPTICGENTNQHIYVDIGANSGDTATLTFTTSATAANRVYDIKVTQVECNNPSSPRDSCCLQYLTGCTGRIMSFNYANTNDNHLNNQQYRICIRQECGFCCVQYSVCPDQAIEDATTGVPPGFSFDTTKDQKSRNDSGCKSNENTIDFIAIPASGNLCAMAGGDCGRAVNNRYCGGFLNQVKDREVNHPICDCTAPFGVDVYFNSNAEKAGALPVATNGISNTKQSRGFCLEYMQIAC